jgi:hypothetical protein
MANRASFMVNAQLLAQALGLPQGTEILSGGLDPFTGLFELLVSHDDLPAGAEGRRVPRVLPTFTRDADGKRPFVSWGPTD